MSAGMTEYGAARDGGYKVHSEDGLSGDSRKEGLNGNDPEGIKKEPEKYSDGYGLEQATTVHEGQAKFSRLGWKRLTICLIVEAIALGSLSIPGAFATIGMVPGVILTVGLGLVGIYSGLLVGQVKLKHPELQDYAEAVQLILGKFGYILGSTMFCLLLVLLVGSHALTGTIAWVRIVDSPGTCAIIFSIVSAIILFLLALPPTFHDFAWLGYVDFVSIIAAIILTIIATGIEAHNAPGGISAVDWHLWPEPGVSFYKAFLAVTNIVFAYSFAVTQFSFMSEMHTPEDFGKSIWALGLIEIVIYTVTGSVIYVFVGSSVSSPALLSSSFTVSRIAFGIALPVIFISGSINGNVVGRYIMNLAFKNSEIRYIHNKRAWIIWIALTAVLTLIAWVIAEAIPFFNALLGLISSLLISGFSYTFPAMFWFMILREGGCFSSVKNIILTTANALMFLLGLVVLVAGTYASVKDIVDEYSSGKVRGSFTCDQSGYSS